MFSLQTGLLTYLFSDVKGIPAAILSVGSILFVVFIAYFLGSINSAIIVSKGLFGDDVRLHGSGNPGLTNMLRTFGAKAALLTLFGDIIKNVLSIFIAGLLFGFHYIGGISVSEYCYVAGLFAIIGHVFPVYYKFKGGKGVLSTAVMVLFLSPIAFLILFALFALIVYLSRYVSLGSVVSAILYPVLLHGYFAVVFGSYMPALTAFTAIAVAILVVYCHRKNLQRISDKTENKLSFGKKKDDE